MEGPKTVLGGSGLDEANPFQKDFASISIGRKDAERDGGVDLTNVS